MGTGVWTLQDIYRDVENIRTDNAPRIGSYEPPWILGVSSEGGWHRIDKNNNTITVSGSVNTTTGTHSFFDDKPIYSDMAAVSMDSLRPGQSMVKIPKFWYKRIGSG